MPRRFVLTALGSVAAMALLGGVLVLVFSRSATGSAPSAGPPPAAAPQKMPQLPVKVFTVRAAALESSVPATGTLLARESVALVSELSRRLVDIRVEEGAKVKQGDVLFVLDSSDLSAQLRQLSVQQKLAKTTAAREESLYEKGLIPTAQRDVVAARVAELEAQRRVLGVELSKTTIRAPFSGTLGLRQVSKGAWVSPEVVLATLHDTSQLKLDFTLPERYSAVVQIGKTFTFRVEGMPKTYEGKVSAFEPRIEAASRSLLVRGIVDAGSDLMPGSFAQVDLAISEKQALMVPSIALIPGLDGRRVFIAKDGSAKSVLVEVGTRNAEQVQIVSGLAAGDQVITTNLLRLRDGAPIRIEAAQE